MVFQNRGGREGENIYPCVKVEQEDRERSKERSKSKKPKKVKKEKKKHKKKKKKNGDRVGKVKLSYEDEDRSGSEGSARSSVSESSVGREEGNVWDSDQEDDEKTIEKIRRKRAKLLARIPEEAAGEVEQAPFVADKAGMEGGQLITSFSQNGDEKEEVKKYKTVICTGSVINDGQFGQIFQLSATVQGTDNR